MLIENKQCSLCQYQNFSNEENLVSYLVNIDKEYQIIYTQWDTTDKTTLSQMVSDLPTLS